VTDDYFGDAVAESYDGEESAEFESSVVDSIVTFLADLAPSGSALELGIGTGRIALPLRERGLHVEGIDLSAAMVAQMKKKPGGGEIRVVLGDFATTAMDRTFDVVFIVFNTIMNLTSQPEQVACFANAAAHLVPNGVFVVEVMIPDLRRLPPGEVLRPFKVEAGALGFDEYDVANQGLTSHHYRVHGDRLDAQSIPFRFVWPAELDLMAAMAGLGLQQRWGGWNGEPFTSESSKHVSVWERLE
jgi:SAM-dependent methyltransferase